MLRRSIAHGNMPRMQIRDVRRENGLDHRRPRAAYEIRRELRAGDPEAIVELHARIYPAEHDRNDLFVEQVAKSVEAALDRGWPDGGGVWIVERQGEVAGSIALTAEGGGVGILRWVVLVPELRGHGLGRRLITEAVARARELGMRRVQLYTFSALRTAGHLYREAGFRVVSAYERSDWGPTITYQEYVLEL
jgi:N-acetylglutamate synthase-like GNAT family acetyltransferase